MITEAVILAGGFGTRLQAAVPGLPKSMAPVAGRPFLSFVIDYLRLQGVEKIVFALGYRHDVIETYLSASYRALRYDCVVEAKPLGTGGALRQALEKAVSENVVAVNGDTLFRVRMAALEGMHREKDALCTMALKPMQQFDRYGVVVTDAEGAVVSFQEKRFYDSGLINGGVYLLNRPAFLAYDFPEVFSMEKDFLEKEAGSKKIYGSVQNGYFMDIGIPEDYSKAQQQLAAQRPDLTKTDKSWSLFLDRDGVINDEKLGKYILNWEQFKFSAGVLDAFPLLAHRFGHIFIVSNQRGVEKGLMTEADLQNIHANMLEQIQTTGALIHRIYYCTAKEDLCFHRKPNPGMALQAFADFPGVDPEKCMMVGNKPSDMRFGRSAGMHTVFVTTTNPHEPFPHPDVDFRFKNLLHFAKALEP